MPEPQLVIRRGEVLAARLARAGHLLAVTYLIPAEAEAFEQAVDLPEDRLFLKRVDAGDPELVSTFMQEVVDRFGRLEIMCGLVGGWAGGRDVEETDDVRFDRMIDLNLRSAFYTVRAAIPHLRKSAWGRIILVGSRAAFETPSGQGAFNAAKAGVVALAKTIADELSDTDVTANVLLPAVIDTPATRAALPYSDYVDWPSPDEIAAVAEFLVSEEAGVITGAAIPVYGRA